MNNHIISVEYREYSIYSSFAGMHLKIPLQYDIREKWVWDTTECCLLWLCSEAVMTQGPCDSHMDKWSKVQPVRL